MESIVKIVLPHTRIVVSVGIVIAVWLLILPGCAKADYDPAYTVEIPSYMAETDDTDSLETFLSSPDSEVRAAVCLRLSQINTDGSVSLLIRAFENEPYREAMELPPGVRYYALTGLGAIGTERAEEYLKQVVGQYAADLGDSPKIWNIADSLSVVGGALEGLDRIGSPSAYAFLDSTYKDRSYYWYIRSRAFRFVALQQLAVESFQTARDTAQYFVGELLRYGPEVKMHGEDGVVTEAYIKARVFLALVHENAEGTVTLLQDEKSKMAREDSGRRAYVDSVISIIQGQSLR